MSQSGIPLVHESDASFLSGHAVVSAALAAALMCLTWRSPDRWPAVVLGTLWTLVVGPSRLYLGAHDPADVLVSTHLIFVRRG